MNTVNFASGRTTPSDLEHVIGPLADYICASDRPKAALNLAVAALFHQVEQMNTLARVHVARRRFATISRN